VVQSLSRQLDNSVSEDRIWPARSWSAFLVSSEVSNLRDIQLLRDQTLSVTLWGSGSLNWRRASREVIDTQMRLYDISSQEFQKEGTGPERGRSFSRVDESVDAIMKLAKEPKVRSLFTDASYTFSLWIIPETGATMATFTVQTTHTGSLPETEGFAW
jgi:hypothetical protein